jgi:hypothetical protein
MHSLVWVGANGNLVDAINNLMLSAVIWFVMAWKNSNITVFRFFSMLLQAISAAASRRFLHLA